MIVKREKIKLEKNLKREKKPKKKDNELLDLIDDDISKVKTDFYG